jgi:hypothetical protein
MNHINIGINLSVDQTNPVYSGCLIEEISGRYSMIRIESDINIVYDNVKSLVKSLTNFSPSFNLTGGSPIAVYLSVIKALDGKVVTYSDGRNINNLDIPMLELSSNIVDETQNIDLTIKESMILDGKVNSGPFQGCTASVAGGRVSLNSDPKDVFESLQKQLIVTGNSVTLTGAMPIWIYMSIARTILAMGYNLNFDDGRGGIYNF